jgi:anti-sigma factor RsiW
LDAVVDGEVDPSARIELERHLASCDHCRDQLAFAQAFRARLRAAAGQPSAPAHLRERVAQSLRDESRPPLRLDTSWRATAVAAAVAVAVFGVGHVVKDGSGALEAGVAPILEDVVRAHTRAYPVDVDAREQVPAYFESKVGFRVAPVDFANPAVRFVGARYSQVGGRQAATMRYDVGGRRVTVVAFRPPAHAADLGELVQAPDGRVLRAVQVRGHVVPLVEHDGVVYAVVSDLEPEDRLELAAKASLQ